MLTWTQTITPLAWNCEHKLNHKQTKHNPRCVLTTTKVAELKVDYIFSRAPQCQDSVHYQSKFCSLVELVKAPEIGWTSLFCVSDKFISWYGRFVNHYILFLHANMTNEGIGIVQLISFPLFTFSHNIYTLARPTNKDSELVWQRNFVLHAHTWLADSMTSHRDWHAS